MVVLAAAVAVLAHLGLAASRDPAATLSATVPAAPSAPPAQAPAKSLHLRRDRPVSNFVSLVGQAVVSFLKAQGDVTVTDLGAGLGYYSTALQKAGVRVQCFDSFADEAWFTSDLCGPIDLSQPIEVPTTDWVISLDSAGRIPQRSAGIYLDNLARTARQGAILSWVPREELGRKPGTPGFDIAREMEARNFSLSESETADLRARTANAANFLKDTITVFRSGGGRDHALYYRGDEGPPWLLNGDLDSGAATPVSSIEISSALSRSTDEKMSPLLCRHCLQKLRSRFCTQLCGRRSEQRGSVANSKRSIARRPRQASNSSPPGVAISPTGRVISHFSNLRQNLQPADGATPARRNHVDASALEMIGRAETRGDDDCYTPTWLKGVGQDCVVVDLRALMDIMSDTVVRTVKAAQGIGSGARVAAARANVATVTPLPKGNWQQGWSKCDCALPAASCDCPAIKLVFLGLSGPLCGLEVNNKIVKREHVSWPWNGYFAGTCGNGTGVAFGDLGVFPGAVRAINHGITTVEKCMSEACERWPECKYVSFNAAAGECAAFPACDVASLSTARPNFVTLAKPGFFGPVETLDPAGL